ncbi:hypothetical protein BDW22DRAFT_1364687 [Trametopsis cervina]|nr:hypothetical protein BDW22DRAFT_1364687 [Trametopsis cervina]
MSLFRSLLSFLPCFPAPDLRRQSSFFDHPDPNGVDLRPPPYHFSAQFRQPLILRRMPHGPAEQYIIRIQVTDCHGSLRHPIMYRLDVAPEYAIRTGMDVVVEELEGGRGHAHLEWGYIAGVRAFEDQYVEFILML